MNFLFLSPYTFKNTSDLIHRYANFIKIYYIIKIVNLNKITYE